MKYSFVTKVMSVLLASAMIVTMVPSDVKAQETVEEDPESAVEVTVEEDIEDTAEETEEEAVEIADESESEYLGSTVIPGAITGVRIEARDGNLRLRCQPAVNIYEYQVRVTDASGIEYTDAVYDHWDPQTGDVYLPEYYRYRSYNSASEVSLSVTDILRYSYKRSADGKSFEIDEKTKKRINAGAPGATYYFQVRGVNYALNAEGTGIDKSKMYAGAWSTAASYTCPTITVKPVSDFKVGEYDKESDKLYFTATGALGMNSQFVVDVSSKNDFSTIEYQYSASTGFDSQVGKFYIQNPQFMKIGKYEAAKKWYIRIYDNSNSDYHSGDVKTGLYSNVVEYSVGGKTIPVVTGLKLAEDTEDYYRFTCNPMEQLDDEIIIEIQFSTDVNFADAESILTTAAVYELDEGGFTVLKHGSNGSGSDGPLKWRRDKKTVYVRARAYAWKTQTQGTENDKIYGAPSNIVTLNAWDDQVSPIGSLQVDESNSGRLVLKYVGTIKASERLLLQYSQDPNFEYKRIEKDDKKKDNVQARYCTTYNGEFATEEFAVSQLDPGKWYFRARVEKRDVNKLDMGENYIYGPFTSTLAVSVLPGDITSVTAKDNTATSVTLVCKATCCTCYEIQLKNGKKWARGTRFNGGEIKLSALTPDTTYQYRVRAVYKAQDKKLYYGGWYYSSFYTWGAPVSLKAKVASANSVKLSWNKIKGATSYEIWRRVAQDNGDSSYKEYETVGFETYSLVKAVSAKTTSYTEKKLDKNCSYYYFVRAINESAGGYRHLNSNEATVNLAFCAPQITSKTMTKKGSTKVTWNKVIGASKVTVEKYDEEKSKWVVYKNLKKTATSVTLPRAGIRSYDVYRICAWKSKKCLRSGNIDIYGDFASKMVSGVKASTNSDGSITVKWNALAGADYYKVYRMTNKAYEYDKTTKEYFYSNSYVVNAYVADAQSATGYSKVNDNKIKTTSVDDRRITYSNKLGENIIVNEGPKAGVQYYYYVIAYKNVAAKDTLLDPEHDYIATKNSKRAKAFIGEVKNPGIKSIKAAKKGKATIKWSKPNVAADNMMFVIERSLDKNFKTIDAMYETTKTSITDKKLKKGKTYYYRMYIKYDDALGGEVITAISKAKKVKAK